MEIEVNKERYTYTPEEYDRRMKIVKPNDFLGKGSYAKVYRALRKSDQKWMAIKIFFDNCQQPEVFYDAVETEVKALRSMEHKNVISISDFGTGTKGNERCICLIMSYIDGWDLQDYWKILEKDSSIGPTLPMLGVSLSREMEILWKKLLVLIQVCNGIEHAHSNKIYHRDLKPGNIRIEQKTGCAYILDFGIAKVLADPLVSQTFTETPQGTPLYMCPEQVKDPVHVNEQCDIWNLGVILYQCVIGKWPFSEKAIEEIQKVKIDQIEEWVCTQEPKEVDSSLVVASLEHIWKKALKKNPGERYPNAKAMAEDLWTWLSKEFVEQVRQKGYSDIETVAYKRLSNEETWKTDVKQYKRCVQLQEPILAPAVFWHGDDDVPEEVELAWPKGTSLQESKLAAKDWEVLLNAIENSIVAAKAVGFSSPSLPSAKYIFVKSNTIIILGICWPYELKLDPTPLTASNLSRFLLEHLSGIPSPLCEMLNLPYEARHSIEDLRDCLKRASELEKMESHLKNGPVDKGMEAAKTLIQWKTSGSELLRGKAIELWYLVERYAGRVPKVVEVRDKKPEEGEGGWLKYPCKNSSGEEETYWIREQKQEMEKKPEVVEESAMPQTPGVSAPSIIVVENKVLPVKTKILTYGLPEDIWAECSYEHEGSRILDMSTSTWLELAEKEGKQGSYAQQYQIGYARASQEGLVPYKGLELEIVIVQGRANIPLILIPPGRFLMGSPKNEKGRYGDETQHLVVIAKPYYMGKTPITQEQWEAVVSAVPEEAWKKIFSKHKWPYNGMPPKPSRFSSSGVSAPVEQVSWYQCAAFCEKLGETLPLGCALPTEAEWEFACRGGSTKRWCFGDDESRLSEYAWYEKNSENHTHPVAAEGKKSNVFGLYDMHGNIWEWVNDWYGSYLHRNIWQWVSDWFSAYPGNSAPDPVGPKSGSNRVGRGGSWCYSASDCRSATRNYWGPDFRYDYLGFRVRALNSIGINLRK